jgi:hypothetical protein
MASAATFYFLGGVNVGGDGDVEFFSDFTENAAALGDAGAAVGVNRGSVGFVVGSLENKIHTEDGR